MSLTSMLVAAKPKGSKVTAAFVVAGIVNVLTIAGAIAGFFPGNQTAVAVAAIAATDAPILAAWLKAEKTKTPVVSSVPGTNPNPPAV